MSAGCFGWYELRAMDVGAARGFYADLLGVEMREVDGGVVMLSRGRVVGEISVLPAQAAARGVPAHWLGGIGVGDVEGVVGRFVARGAQQLGPTRRSGEGELRVALRDPFGATVAVTSRRGETDPLFVVWHQLQTRDREGAFAMYSEFFGWRRLPGLEIDLGPEVGPLEFFAWDDSGRAAGGMANTALMAHIHLHWMFYFGVEDIDAALEKVRAAKGIVAGEQTLPSGDRIAQCDDPQGAAFGLYQARA